MTATRPRSATLDTRPILDPFGMPINPADEITHDDLTLSSPIDADYERWAAEIDAGDVELHECPGECPGECF